MPEPKHLARIAVAVLAYHRANPGATVSAISGAVGAPAGDVARVIDEYDVTGPPEYRGPGQGAGW